MRTRRHVAPSAVEQLQSTAWRRFLRDLAIIAAVAAAGFALSSSWIAPGQMLASDHAVPRVLDLPEADALRGLEGAGFRPRTDGEQPSADVPRGTVIWQDPPPGMVLPPGTGVQVVLSGGPAPATVPDVIGMAQPYAEKIIEAAGIKVGSVDTVTGGTEAGVVLATRPAPGHGRPRGSAIELVVSAGPGGGR